MQRRPSIENDGNNNNEMNEMNLFSPHKASKINDF